MEHAQTANTTTKAITCQTNLNGYRASRHDLYVVILKGSENTVRLCAMWYCSP